MDYLLSDGTVLHAPAVRLGGRSYALCFRFGGYELKSTTVYDAAGNVLAHETTPTKP